MIKYTQHKTPVYVMKLTRLKNYIHNYHRSKALIILISNSTRIDTDNINVCTKANVLDILNMTENYNTPHTKEYYKVIGEFINNYKKTLSQQECCIILGGT